MRGWFCLLGIFALLLTGCQAAPPEAELRREVESLLASALPANTIEITRLERRGAQRDAESPTGTEQRVVYFDIELRLLRDYDFGAWDEPGIAGLISALGAGPKGLQGITGGGNRAGDVVRAHGTMVYQRDGKQWTALHPRGYSQVTAPALGGESESAPEMLLGALRSTMARVPPEASSALREAIKQELEHAYAAVNARIVRAERGYAIAAGPVSGQYMRLVQAFAANPAAHIVPIITAGGADNLRLLRRGDVDFALTQGDAALAAYRGEGIFANEGPFAGMQAVGSLYPEAVHVITRHDSALDSLAALRDRRVAIGLPGSAARGTTLAVLAAHGLGVEDIEVREMAFGSALVALRERGVDAVITVIGLPADTIREAAGSVPLEMLDLDAAAIGTLAMGAAFLPLEIPRGTYPGINHAVRTVATPAVLLARSELSAAEIEHVTRNVYASRRDLATLGSAQGPQISPARARLAIPIPQHAAALRVLEELAPAQLR